MDRDHTPPPLSQSGILNVTVLLVFVADNRVVHCFINGDPVTRYLVNSADGLLRDVEPEITGRHDGQNYCYSNYDYFHTWFHYGHGREPAHSTGRVCGVKAGAGRHREAIVGAAYFGTAANNAVGETGDHVRHPGECRTPAVAHEQGVSTGNALAGPEPFLTLPLFQQFLPL